MEKVKLSKSVMGKSAAIDFWNNRNAVLVSGDTFIKVNDPDVYEYDTKPKIIGNLLLSDDKGGMYDYILLSSVNKSVDSFDPYSNAFLEPFNERYGQVTIRDDNIFNVINSDDKSLNYGSIARVVKGIADLSVYSFYLEGVLDRFVSEKDYRKLIISRNKYDITTFTSNNVTINNELRVKTLQIPSPSRKFENLNTNAKNKYRQIQGSVDNISLNHIFQESIIGNYRPYKILFKPKDGFYNFHLNGLTYWASHYNTRMKYNPSSLAIVRYYNKENIVIFDASSVISSLPNPNLPPIIFYIMIQKTEKESVTFESTIKLPISGKVQLVKNGLRLIFSRETQTNYKIKIEKLDDNLVYKINDEENIIESNENPYFKEVRIIG